MEIWTIRSPWKGLEASKWTRKERYSSFRRLFRPLFGLIPYLVIWACLGQTRGTCAQAHEKELLECGSQLSVQLPISPEGLPSRDEIGR